MTNRLVFSLDDLIEEVIKDRDMLGLIDGPVNNVLMNTSKNIATKTKNEVLGENVVLWHAQIDWKAFSAP